MELLYSILNLRKVNNSTIELWDYIETVPWHGMDPYAAVVPTLGDSSMHEEHESTFMVTAHTNDVNVWLDSEPMSGYSIDNLHPGTPMSLAFSTAPGSNGTNTISTVVPFIAHNL